MNSKFKMSLLLLATLSIGMVLGALLQSYYLHNMWKGKVRQMRTAQGFTRHFIKIIDPNEEQRPEIEKILLKTHQKFEKRIRPQIDRAKNIMDSLKADLKPVLTAEQFQKLEKHMERMEGPPFKRPRDKHRRHDARIE